ncbi:MAG: amino acid adenylation domain-containing protein, partial [Acidobacteriaceae bacterium]|nr:amino acid adenylation domain-containing protein [Acidobacteriaceae bacterium]
EEDQLRALARSLADSFGGRYSDADLQDVSYTLLAGRDAMKHRLAVVVQTAAELQSKLRAFANGQAGGVLTGCVERRATAPAIAGSSLEAMGKHWVNGGELDLDAMFQRGQRRLLHLPTYPFAPTRPAAGTVLDPAAFYLRDHRIHSQSVLPGAMSLELVRTAFGEAVPVTMRQILWRQPVIVESQPVTARVDLDAAKGGFRFVTGQDTVHLQGFIAAGAEEGGHIDIAAVRSRCREQITAQEFYAVFEPSGIAYGPSFRPVEQAFAGEVDALTKLHLPKTVPSHFVLHPVMLDGAFQSCALLLRGLGSETAVPFALERLEVMRPTGDEIWVHVRDTLSAGASIRRFDIDLADGDGRVCVRARGFSLRTMTAPSPQPPRQQRVRDTRALLAQLVADESGVSRNSISSEEPLEAYGLDSMMIGKLTDRLEREYGPLSKTLFFEYQTIEQLACYLDEEHPAPATPKVQAKPAAQGAIAIIGVAGRYPGARNLDEFWENLARGRDCITEVPRSRWDHSRYYDPESRAPGKTNSKWGGFIDDAECFDPLFFNVSPREAEFLDPQERIFLQCAWEALEDAGYTRATLAPAAAPMAGGNVGVFVGVMYEEYQLWGAEMTAAGRPTVLSSSAASIANRVSYFCDFHGPSLTVDTMCSSSLTAIHLACESLRAGSCQVALAGGVNLNLHPNKYLTLAQGRFTSTTGRCESYGRGGDGYVPGEGAGAVILKPLERAIADGDQIYGVVRASALNHGGKTNGYTVPNPHAQAAVITAALERGGVDARAISYIEGHGTGTSLGDPIEIAALSRAFRAHTQEREFCAIGSVKSNIGHCESAAGIAGLTKVLLQMKHGMLAPSLHSETLNPAIDFPRSPFRVQRRLEAWPRPGSGARLAGISAFGAGGSNVHLIVEAYESPGRLEVGQRPRVFPFSAHNEEQLTALLQRHMAASARYTDQDLPAIARVLQEGREVFAQRVAVVASTLADLQAQIAAYLKNREVSLSGRDPLCRVAREWMEHGKSDWAALREAGATRVSLPTYPFAEERFWAPMPAASPMMLPLLFAPSWRAQPAQPSRRPDSVVTVFAGVDSAGTDGIRIPSDDYTSAAVELLGVVQDIVKQRPKSALLQVVVPAGSELAGLGGLLRTAQWEHASVQCQLVEWDGAAANLAGRLAAEQSSGDTHIRYAKGSQRQVREWRELTPERNVAMPWKDGGVYLIAGGAGGLGLLLAEEIASSVRRPVLWLTSRSPMGEPARARLTTRGGVVEHRQVDVTDRPQMDGLIREILERHGRLDGVIHAAGILRDRRLVRKSAAEFREVLAPKVDGILNLDAATAGCRMDFVLLFASISGALGNAGQCDYAAANGFLDSFAARRNRQVERGERYGRTISLDWPYWNAGGMRLEESVIEGMRSGFGVVPLETDAGMAALRAAFGFNESQLVILDGERDRLRRALRPPEVVAAPAPPPQRDDLTGRIRHHLSRVLQVPAEKLRASETLDRYGLDSVTGMDVIESLSKELDRKLPPTLLLEYPRIDLLAAHLNEIVPAPAVAGPVVERGKDIAIIAIAGRYPGADTIDDFWDLLQQGRDCITEIPDERWDANSSASTYCKWGGFLSDVDRFDASFFGVSPRDAALMDPQERLFLENVFRLLESAGYTNAHLREAFGSRVGVYVGAMSQQYHAVEADPDQKALVSMSSYASIANRVSFHFDLQGPSVALDTMCSSGLHAVHLASRALQADECKLAIAGGVNISIHPNKYRALSRTGLLGSSPDSRSFADGDGYLPAEGVGAVLLKPLVDARRDGDRILAVIKGSAANHGGHSAGFMTPSAEAQARLIEENFRATGVDPRTVSYVEAAATGSALSDSMEVRALTRAFRSFTRDVGFCALGTVKSNMGHAEAASGMAQLTKVILQLDRRKLAPTLPTRHPNPHIDLNGTPFVLQSSLTDWAPPNGAPRRAAISSFGAGGSNLHLILEEAPATVASEESMAGPPWRFVFSAHSEERLAQWMETIHDYVAGHAALSLPRLAYTLEERRTRMECVRVITAGNRQQLLDALAAPERHPLHTEVDEPSGILRGAPLPLPPYPLQRERYWLLVSKDANPAPATLPERIVSLLQEELGVPVQATDSFQSLGMDSMASQRLIHAVSESTGVPIRYADLTAHPTPATLASYVGGIQPAARNGHWPEREFPCALTEGQRALWVFQKLYPSSAVYNVPLAFAVEHPNLDALERACSWIVNAYPILGTIVDGDLQLRPAERAARLQVLQVPPLMDAMAFARQRAATPFDLQEAVPIRFELLDGLTPILLIVVHHIVFDGISAAVFAMAFWQAYGHSEELEKPVAASFASFSEWEQQYLASSAAERDRDWWLNQFSREVPTLNLAIAGSSASLDVELPVGLVAQVKSFSAELGVSASVLFLGAFAILLSRYCDAEEFVVGVPAAARPQSRFQETIGYFANVLPIRIAPAGAHPVADYLRALQTTFSAALDHSQYPLARLLRDMKRDALAAPLFHATFSYQSFLNSLELPGTQHLAEIRQEGDAAFGLEVHASSLVAVYDEQQFDASSVRSMLAHYMRLLGAVVANSRQRVADLQMLTQPERDNILAQWSRGEELRPARVSVCSSIDRRSAAVPNAVAIVTDQESWTYSAFAKRVNHLTNYLRQRELQPGARVAVCLGRAPECIAVMLSVWKAGCVWVPLDAAWPAERLAFTIRDSGAALVIADDSTAGALKSVPPARLLLLSRAQKAIERCSAKPARYRTPLSGDAYIIYTSGSTGRPKGVVVSHAALATHCMAAVRAYGITRRDVVLQFSAHSVDPALEQLLPALMRGATIVMRTHDLWTPSAFERLIHKQRITVADLPPAYLHELLLAWPAGATSHDLRLLLCGGESLSPDTVRLWQASPLGTVRLLNVYGPTEATITSTYHEVTKADAAARSVPIGRPFPAREIYILDQYGNLVPEGVTGELHIGGPCLGTAYQGSEELTRSRFTPNPFSAGRLYRTGDRASFVPGANGLLAFHGRKDEQVKIRGF